MKKLFILLFTFSSIFSVSAQEFPNGNMEDWFLLSLFFNTPVGYVSSETRTLIPGYPSNVVQSTDAYEGTSSVRLETVVDSSSAWLVAGVVDFTDPYNPEFLPGAPYTDRPSSFGGYFKGQVDNGDTASIIIFLVKNDDSDTLGMAQWTFEGTQDTWAPFSVDFEYSSMETPEEVHIDVYTDVNSPPSVNGVDVYYPGQLHVGNWLMLDALTFELGTGIRQPFVSVNPLKVFPNPAEDYIRVELMKQPATKNVELHILDGQGKTLKVEQFSGTEHLITLPELASGVYYFQLFGGDGKLLDGGSFILK